ncbi:hypothetical protein JIG36_05540 [Actinoplanes sp. LDG1-06]|uniref:Uncharacterized protein n=1 Tax=Paractinoplanes ovalisporus TaxID=2810368 RepID=A0ABS2A6Z6_9ACTN|nr:hypothetical protein [Actinoplanes ovalisporus]MBM2615021.1 hypothetical protein [Actinoplanes ovalisporus]
MNDVLEQSEPGREIARRNREQGLEQGLEQGRVEVMRALLRARYGDLADLDNLARRLAGSDYGYYVDRIVAGATSGELWALSCAQIARATPIILRVVE